jgi:hypothetical protein
MAECIECKGYTKFNGGLCTNCYSKKNQNKRSFTEDVDFEEKPLGLSDRDYNYRYSMIKGRIAETLIQELFLSLEYNVFRFGMENTIPGIIELLKGVRTDVADDIRRMPDFVLQNRKTKDVHFVEVKFRANGEFTIKDLPKDYPYTNAYIILVSKKHIKCVTYEELEAGEIITPSSKNWLGNRKEFDLDKEVIKDFCDFALKFFENV